jgi:hypothetical protein
MKIIKGLTEVKVHHGEMHYSIVENNYMIPTCVGVCIFYCLNAKNRKGTNL